MVHFWYFEDSTFCISYNSYNYNNYQTINLIIILYVFSHKYWKGSLHLSLNMWLIKKFMKAWISIWNGKKMIKNDENHDILIFLNNILLRKCILLLNFPFDGGLFYLKFWHYYAFFFYFTFSTFFFDKPSAIISKVHYESFFS